jgi:hypothetical protein
MANDAPKPDPRPNPMPASPPPGFAIPETRSGDQAIVTEKS